MPVGKKWKEMKVWCLQAKGRGMAQRERERDSERERQGCRLI
uniref:Uncharacterized protein n=1 Tax=Anguilla anguilla TaxID=7936 RepID=A0A0E9Q5X8_ANGAN